jgi:REP-associated tyrosine transposase
MPRPLRNEEPGATYHVTINAVEGSTIVRDDVDHATLLRLAAAVIPRQGWICLAFCILNTHFHLLVTTPKPNLAEGMQLLNGRYAQLFNRRHERKGHLFCSRYYAGRIRSEAHLLLTVRYIARNPVEAGTVENPCDARWSSYAGVVSGSGCWPFIDREWLLELFGGGEAGLAALRDFVEDVPLAAARV